MTTTSTSTVDPQGFTTYVTHEDYPDVRLAYAGGRLADIERDTGCEWVAVDCCHAAEGYDWERGAYPHPVTAQDLEATFLAVLTDSLQDA
jgi:hypothetical protein